MIKLLVKFLLLICFLLPKPMTNGNNIKQEANAPTIITGGTVEFDFSNPEDLVRFDMYTSYYTLPRIYDSVLYTYLYAEQKIILKDIQLNEYLIEADIGPSIYNGHIDMGFYLQAANPGPEVDNITAWQLNIKHDDFKATWDLRLYRFENGRWLGKYAEAKNLPFWESEWIHLSALVKDGYVTAYLNHNYDEPLFVQAIGTGKGLVGIRSFKSPGKITNLKITAPDFALNTTALEALIAECAALNYTLYTPVSWLKLSEEKTKAEQLLTTTFNQLQVNDAVKALQQAKDNLLLVRTFAELQTLIAECDLITAEDEYTRNSYQSFKMCLERAKTMTADSNVEDISYIYAMLIYRKNELIKYGGQ